MTQTLTTEAIKLWRINAGITLGETDELDPENNAAKAILALTEELLANREAQPVFYVEKATAPAETLQTIVDAPAVNAALCVFYEDATNDNAFFLVRAIMEACRVAMLGQPVSQRYKLPEGFKLMPIEITDEIAEAIALEARCCGGIALCIYEAALAAAPEGGNG